MEKKRCDYIAPFTEVTCVEVESSICSGSVQFGDQKNQVDIIDQRINQDQTSQDFSGEEWTMTATGN